MPLPKVLILNQPFNTNTGGGITLSNLFANWGRDKLAVACSGYLLNDNIDPKLCDNYYQLGSKERKWIFPLNLLSRTYYSGPIKPTKNTKGKLVVEKSKFRDKLIMNYAMPFLEYIGFDHFKAKSRLSSQFCEWLDDFNPDVIYAQAYTREDILFCIVLKKHLKKKPLIFHMMDDWPSTVGSKGFMKKYWEIKLNEELQLLLEYTDLAMSISDYMAEEYKRRYGKEFSIFHNPINIDFWRSAQKKEYNLSAPPTMLYAGRVGLGIDQSLKTLAQAVDRVNQDFGTQLKFTLQTQKIPSWIKDYDCTEHRGFVAYEKLPKVFAQADFLVLPYDFSAKSLSFIKYSMPTKAPEYMASGTPILIFAPKNTALVQYAKDYEWATVVTENKIDELVDIITGLLKHKSRREKIAFRAKNLAEQRHDSKMVASDFQNAILSELSN